MRVVGAGGVQAARPTQPLEQPLPRDFTRFPGQMVVDLHHAALDKGCAGHGRHAPEQILKRLPIRLRDIE